MVQCRFDEKRSDDCYELFDPKDKTYRRHDLGKLAEAITNIQNRVLVECGRKIAEEEPLELPVGVIGRSDGRAGCRAGRRKGCWLVERSAGRPGGRSAGRLGRANRSGPS